MTQVTVEHAMAVAMKHRRAGRLGEAESIYRCILAVEPNHPDALHLLGMVASDTGRDDLAIDLIRQAIAAAPSNPIYHWDLGSLLQSQNQLDQAIDCYRRALVLKPDFAEAHYNLGLLYNGVGQLDQAIACYERALALNPNFAGAYNNLGVSLTHAGRLDEAMACLHKAIALRPDFHDAHNNLGKALRQSGQVDAAIISYRTALRLKPTGAEALSNLANALRHQGHMDEAIACYRQSIALRPDLPDLHNNLAHGLLTIGEFAEGWAEFEWRWKSSGFEPRRDLSKPQWTGADQSAPTVLLLAEQGYGDMIQFIRYVPMVAARCQRVVVECPADQIALFEAMPGIAQLIARGQELPAFDAYCPLVSLPGIFKTTLESIPAQVPYLHADPKRVADWALRLASDSRRKIGLAWAGSPIQANDRNRSMPLSAFAALGEIPGIEFHSLQKGSGARQMQSLPPGLTIVDRTCDIHDFADTAALIANLDLVISVDTSVAHLAGAMAKPVWTLLTFSPDWRWHLNRLDSPWYPTMRLFRQSVHGDWGGVMRQVAGELRGRLGCRA